MNRQIKFRGLRTDGKGFSFGYYCNIQEKEHYILEPCALGLAWTEVIPETVGQFTGLKDKNGKDIYEGDMFAPESNNEEVKVIVRWDENSAKFVVDSYGYNFHIGEGSQEVYDNELSICETNDLSDIILEYCEVIGNIYTTHDKRKEESC